MPRVSFTHDVKTTFYFTLSPVTIKFLPILYNFFDWDFKKQLLRPRIRLSVCLPESV